MNISILNKLKFSLGKQVIMLLLTGNAVFPLYAQQDQEPLFVSKQFTATGSFTAGVEGPAVDAAGNVYAVNFQKEGTIGVVNTQGMASIFVTLPQGSTGNGIRFGSKGTMFVADYTGHNILKVDMATRAVRVFAHSSAMTQPNDIAISRRNSFFASDPSWKNGSGAIWYISSKGKVKLREANMGTTNGIELSPDNKKLYVNESVQRKVWVYDVNKKGRIRNKKLLIEFSDHGMDGMRCDARGNLYIARYGKGTVAIVSPQGTLLHEVTLIGQKPTNIAFGGPDGKTVYVTMQDKGNIETFRTDTPGQEWMLRQQ